MKIQTIVNIEESGYQKMDIVLRAGPYKREMARVKVTKKGARQLIKVLARML